MIGVPAPHGILNQRSQDEDCRVECGSSYEYMTPLLQYNNRHSYTIYMPTEKRGWDEREIGLWPPTALRVGRAIHHQDQDQIRRTTECRSGVPGRHVPQSRVRVHDDAVRLPSSESRRVANPLPSSVERMMLLL
jgi:hypothetical protein